MADTDGLNVPLDTHITSDGSSGGAAQTPTHLQQQASHLPHVQVQAAVAAAAAASGVSVGVPTISTPVASPSGAATTPTSGANPRKGKQYKCGFCHELGHNSKTCPRRLAGTDEVPAKPTRLPPAPAPALTLNSLQPPRPAPVLAPASLVGVPPAPAVLAHPPPPHVPVRPEHERIGALPLDAAISAARRRVIDAEVLVANAGTAEEFENATKQLDASVLSLEKVVLCAQRVSIAIRNYNGV